MKLGKEEILEKVIQCAEEEGWSNITVRSIADAIGYSTIKIYSDFGSKKSLLIEIQKKGFKKLKSKYAESIVGIEQPTDQLIAVSCAHALFAYKQRALYDLMFSLNGADRNATVLSAQQKAIQGIQQILDPLHNHDKSTIFLQYFAFIHGLAITVRNQAAISEEELTGLVKFAIQNFIKGIQ